MPAGPMPMGMDGGGGMGIPPGLLEQLQGLPPEMLEALIQLLMEQLQGGGAGMPPTMGGMPPDMGGMPPDMGGMPLPPGM